MPESMTSNVQTHIHHSEICQWQKNNNQKHNLKKLRESCWPSAKESSLQYEHENNYNDNHKKTFTSQVRLT